LHSQQNFAACFRWTLCDRLIIPDADHKQKSKRPDRLVMKLQSDKINFYPLPHSELGGGAH
jgi:hypothetical protein